MLQEMKMQEGAQHEHGGEKSLRSQPNTCETKQDSDLKSSFNKRLTLLIQTDFKNSACFKLCWIIVHEEKNIQVSRWRLSRSVDVFLQNQKRKNNLWFHDLFSVEECVLLLSETLFLQTEASELLADPELIMNPPLRER